MDLVVWTHTESVALIHGEPIKPDIVLGREFLSGYLVTLVASVGPPIRRPQYLRKEVKSKILRLIPSCIQTATFIDVIANECEAISIR